MTSLITMEEKPYNELDSFLKSGLYRLRENGAVFIDPVRLLNLSYTRYYISASGYYCRSFDPSGQGRGTNLETNASGPMKKKKKRKRRRFHDLNEHELIMERCHQEIRSLLLKAQEALLGTRELLFVLPNLMENEKFSLDKRGLGQNFVELGRIWQAPLYEIAMHIEENSKEVQVEGLQHVESSGRTIVPLFNNLIINTASTEVDAEFLGRKYILPRRSCFHVSDLRRIHDLIPGCSDHGFNLIVIDPPWENGSAYQKYLYPTLPNRYFLYLPIKQLAHTDGALVALWMTNRGKLRAFVEKELFPAWGVTDIRTSYWLKKTEPGCLQSLQDNQIFVSIPGAYSRKPPLGKLLVDYAPGPKPSRCIELFARELLAEWTSWGNEPLHFQDSVYFIQSEVA